MGKCLLGFLVVFGLMFSSVFAQEDQMCTEEVIVSFFPRPFVEKTLDRYEIPDEFREDIYRELALKDKQVVSTVEEKASKINPNPLQDATRRHEAVTLFRATLFELFSQVMNDYNITDGQQIQEMLDDIQRQKLERFRYCVEKVHPGTTQSD